MCSGVSIALVAAAVASAGAQIYSATQTPDVPKLPSPVAPTVPEGPATLPDQSNFAKQRGVTPLQSPEGVSFGAGITDQQKRTQIATQALAGNTGEYRTPEVQRFYKDLAFRTLTDESGNPSGDPSGIERQFARDVLGVQPRQGTTSSFLSALLRS